MSHPVVCVSHIADKLTSAVVWEFNAPMRMGYRGLRMAIGDRKRKFMQRELPKMVRKLLCLGLIFAPGKNRERERPCAGFVCCSTTLQASPLCLISIPLCVSLVP